MSVDEQFLRLEDLAEQPEPAKEKLQDVPLPEERIQACIAYIESRQSSVVANREAEQLFTRPVYLAAAVRMRTQKSLEHNQPPTPAS